MGKYQREKGARFEREIANKLKEVFDQEQLEAQDSVFQETPELMLIVPKSGLSARLAKDRISKPLLNRQRQQKKLLTLAKHLWPFVSGTGKSP